MVFYTDLDNTIIYSYRHDIGEKKICVETYQGRESSFITEITYALLQELKAQALIVPISTRTIEQYERIDLRVGSFPYALVCNGGVLLVNGERDESWYRQSLRDIEMSYDELRMAKTFLENEPRRKLDVRFIEKMFVFTKCMEPENVIHSLRAKLNAENVDIFNNGEKIYIVPKNLNKGKALQRFKDYIGDSFAVAAGDSEFDVSMLRMADERLAPYGFRSRFHIEFPVREAGKIDIFSEYALSGCIKIMSGNKTVADGS